MLTTCWWKINSAVSGTSSKDMPQVIAWLNDLANRFASIFLSPIAWLPGWLSATIVGVVTGVLMLIVFKYTSHQSAIKQTHDQIKAMTTADRIVNLGTRQGYVTPWITTSAEKRP